MARPALQNALLLLILSYTVYGFVAVAEAVEAAGADVVVPRASSDSSSTQFDLYAYGKNIGGLQLFYADGLAQLGNSSLSNASSIAAVYFDHNSTSVIANPNTTLTPNATWTDQQLFIPSGTSTDKYVGFTSGPSAQNITNEFTMFGSYVMVNSSAGIESLFYAQPSGSAGIYSLLWNLSGSDQTSGNAVPVSLRRTAPSN